MEIEIHNNEEALQALLADTGAVEIKVFQK
jgi:hypothetical protein